MTKGCAVLVAGLAVNVARMCDVVLQSGSVTAALAVVLVHTWAGVPAKQGADGVPHTVSVRHLVLLNGHQSTWSVTSNDCDGVFGKLTFASWVVDQRS